MTVIARLLLFLVVFQSSAFAFEEIQFQLDSFESAFFRSDKIELNFTAADSAVPGLSVHVNNIQSPYFEKRLDAALHCVAAKITLVKITCEKGEIELLYPDQEPLLASTSFAINTLNNSGQLILSATSEWGNLSVVYQANSKGEWQAEVMSEDLELPYLAGILQSILEGLPGYSIIKGKTSLHSQLRGTDTSINTIMVNATINDLSIEGESILENVTLHTSADWKYVSGRWSFVQSLRILAGEMYIQPGLSILGSQPGFYIAMAEEPLEFDLSGNWFPHEKIIDLQDLHYVHPDILELRGSVRLTLAEKIAYSDLGLQVSIKDLANAYPVYIQPILMQSNFSNLELSGSIALGLDYDGSILNSVELIIDDVYLEDDDSRFGLYALNSHLLVSSDLEPVQSTLRWEGLSIYKLDLGSGDVVFESSGKDVKVLNWQDVSVLDGGLKINEFAIRNLGSREFELELGGKLAPISMKTLTHALGWKVFPGKLFGEISGLKYTKNNLSLEGDIVFNVFSGKLTIQELNIEDIFSSYSVLTTDIKIDQLDLEQLTDVFTFGKIEGSLGGSIEKLRLEDWRPSYFEMQIETPIDDERPHRISQKALENINELGGGMSGTLSQGFLRFLPAYSYGRMGISCRLANGICELGGVEDSGDGFSILTKGGMLPPWVEVKGAGRTIKWDELVGGLKQIAEGEVKIE